MPISTPESMLPLYRDDKDHFQHVLECLFIPAIEKAGLKPIAPIAKGADVIHAEIIRNLESAELVLCDMSSLNANVFFELGIRTALAKPVCVLKDDATARVPFDMTVVNYHTYQSGLHPWALAKEIDAITEHIRQTRERSQGTNMLWRYFSMNQRAELSISKDPTGERLALMMAQMEGLSKKIDFLEGTSLVPVPKDNCWEVILFSVPEGRGPAVIETLCRLTKMSPTVAEELIDHVPAVVSRGLGKSTAFEMRGRLEVAGADAKVRSR
jgi:ribosomal protein L7/L12